MRLSAIAAFIAAGALLAGGLVTSAQAGWFGLGGSDKSSDSSKSKTAAASSQSKTASAAGAKTSQKPPTSSKSSGTSFFGLGAKPDPKKTSSKPDPKTKNGLYASKQKQPAKSSGSWLTSWMKPKEPPPPKTTADWMKLKQVQY